MYALPASLFVPSPHAIRIAAYSMSKLFGRKSRANKQKILYASRIGAKRNLVIGEHLLEAELLRKYGENVEIFAGSELTLVKQINSFFNAQIIVGVHGAALSNIIFSQRNSYLLELPLSPFDEGLYFKLLCAALGIKYTPFKIASSRYLGTLVINTKLLFALTYAIDEIAYKKL